MFSEGDEIRITKMGLDDMSAFKYANLIFKDRVGTNCEKWDSLKEIFGRNDVISAWVADMDLEAPKCVQTAIMDAADHNIYGYYKAPGSLNKAFIEWESKYHAYNIDEDWIRFSPGVVQSIYWLIQIFTKPKDAVIICEPVYYPFKNAIQQTGRTVVSVPLVNANGLYTIDYDAFEEAVVKNNVKMHILCSPHNPVGRVWKREELQRLLDICIKHNVMVLSDEIHQDLVLVPSSQDFGKDSFEENIPAATVGEYDSILITLTSATKAFNLAGMQNSFIIIPDAELRKKVDSFLEKMHILDGGNMGYIACAAAYLYGREWLTDLRCLIRDNAKMVEEFLCKEASGIIISPLEGTYLQWLDLSKYAKIWETQGKTIDRYIVDECRIAPDFGEWFGGDSYKNHIRLNLATDPKNIKEAAIRLSNGLKE